MPKLGTQMAPERIREYTLIATGVLALAGWITLSLKSDRFGYAFQVFDMPVFELVFLLVGLGILYLFSLFVLSRMSSGLPIFQNHVFMICIALGLAMRLVLIPSEPMLEDDYQRYFWDGGLTAHGFNPYEFSPTSIISKDSIPEGITALAAESGKTIERINHPDLRTIYPAFAQLTFAIAHWIAPWSLTAWKSVLLVFDGLTLGLLLFLLNLLGRSPYWSLVYWWNPVVVKELFNSAHMEAVLIPLVLASVIFSIRRKYIASALTLGLAIATKIWPLILIPIIWRDLWERPKKLIVTSLIMAGVVFVLFLPVLYAGLDNSSGFVAYAERWKTNSALTPALESAVKSLLTVLNAEFISYKMATRVLLVGLLGLSILILSLQPVHSTDDVLKRTALAVSLLLLLSPAQFPWYLIWTIPFLVFAPLPGILILTVTLPLYYSAFYFIPREMEPVFTGTIVWIIWAPAWILFAWMLLAKRNPFLPSSLLTKGQK